MRFHTTAIVVLLLLVTNSGFADGLPYDDADILGIEISGQLLAPPTLVSWIRQDLELIVLAFPDLSDIHVYPQWAPGELLVALTEDAWAEFQAGTFAELDSLNSEYGPVTIDLQSFIRCLVIQFEVLYHPEVLGGIYEEVDGVLFANPNGYFGDGNDIFSDQVSVYTFKRGWGDCPSGCLFADYWVFSVNGGAVDLIDHYSTSVSAVVPGPAGQSTAIKGIDPNPFNPSTTIKYHLKQDDWVSLEVFDLRGRPIIELVNGYVHAGEHQVTWGGMDRSGAPVASGLYFCRLIAVGFAQVQKMTFLK